MAEQSRIPSRHGNSSRKSESVSQPDRSTRGYHCFWCQSSITDADVFLYELEFEGWKQGGLIAPEHPDFETGARPYPACAACRKSIHANYESLRAEKKQEPPKRQRRRRKSLMLLVLAIAFLLWLNFS